MARVKMNITMDDQLVSDLDAYCEKNYMTRSAVISQSVLSLINQQKLIDAISSLSQSIEMCAKAGQLDDETRKEMERFEALSKLFVK